MIGLRWLFLSLILAVPARAAEDPAAVTRGQYLYRAADCEGCHAAEPATGAPSGGRALNTPFGVFYAPNISADPKNGIGAWNAPEFRQAIRQGIAPGGKSLFPVFPFPSFSGLTDQDIDDIRAYILSLPAIPTANTPHQIAFPFGWRGLMSGWRALFLTQGPLPAQPSKSADWNRGNYLVNAVAHCGECHTPRNALGALKTAEAFSGNIGGPDGQNAPNITSDPQTGIGAWSVADIEHLLETGETPDFDSVASGMAVVVRSLRDLTPADRHAMAVYLKSLPPIHNERLPPKSG